MRKSRCARDDRRERLHGRVAEVGCPSGSGSPIGYFRSRGRPRSASRRRWWRLGELCSRSLRDRGRVGAGDPLPCRSAAASRGNPTSPRSWPRDVRRDAQRVLLEALPVGSIQSSMWWTIKRSRATGAHDPLSGCASTADVPVPVVARLVREVAEDIARYVRRDPNPFGVLLIEVGVPVTHCPAPGRATRSAAEVGRVASIAPVVGPFDENANFRLSAGGGRTCSRPSSPCRCGSVAWHPPRDHRRPDQVLEAFVRR